MSVSAPDATHSLPPRTAEDWANTLSHLLGLLLAVVGAVVLWARAAEVAAPERRWAVAVYAVALCLLYAASTVYHAHRCPRRRHWWQRVDHAAIYLMIAGTWTPILLLAEHTLAPAPWLVAVWLAAGAGVALKVCTDPARWPRLSTLGYLLLGWLSLPLLWSAWPSLSALARGAIIGGGVVYSLGTILFHLDDRIRFGHAAWHGCVLLASGAHWLAVWQLLALPAG